MTEHLRSSVADCGASLPAQSDEGSGTAHGESGAMQAAVLGRQRVAHTGCGATWRGRALGPPDDRRSVRGPSDPAPPDHPRPEPRNYNPGFGSVLSRTVREQPVLSHARMTTRYFLPKCRRTELATLAT
jgi:hypothetical protein